MPNRANLTHTPYQGDVLGYGGDMAPYDHRKFVLDFWLGILLAMATIVAIELVLIIPYGFSHP
jgi:hypothetical protein